MKGKVDWTDDEKDRCWFDLLLSRRLHKAAWKGEHRFWQARQCFMTPIRRADRIRFSQYSLKLVFCMAVWSICWAISSMMVCAHVSNFLKLVSHEGYEGDVAGCRDMAVSVRFVKSLDLMARLMFA